MFKTSKLAFVDAAPATARRVRYWDKAATAAGGDFTAGVLMSESEKVYYIEDIVRGQWDTSERDRIIRQTTELDGRAVKVSGEQEPGASGKDAAKAFVQLLAGFSVTTAPASGTKELRADPLSSQVNNGNVRMVRGAWNRDFIQELGAFPLSKHDDQVDAASGAFNILALTAPKTLYIFRR